jgi:hypothetical protein
MLAKEQKHEENKTFWNFVYSIDKYYKNKVYDIFQDYRFWNSISVTKIIVQKVMTAIFVVPNIIRKLYEINKQLIRNTI